MRDRKVSWLVLLLARVARANSGKLAVYVLLGIFVEYVPSLGPPLLRARPAQHPLDVVINYSRGKNVAKFSAEVQIVHELLHERAKAPLIDRLELVKILHPIAIDASDIRALDELPPELLDVVDVRCSAIRVSPLLVAWPAGNHAATMGG
jgi:hypothetical protein